MSCFSGGTGVVLAVISVALFFIGFAVGLAAER